MDHLLHTEERALEIHHVDAYFVQSRYFPAQLLNMFQEMCLGTPQLPGLLEEAEMPCLYRKEWLVSG